MKCKTAVFTIIVLAISAICAAEQPKLADISVLDLATAQQIALADNPSLQAGAERVEQAKQRVEQAKALYHPTLALEGTGAYNRLSKNSTAVQSSQSGSTVDRNQEAYNLSLAANWLVFDGFARKFTNLTAKYGSDESEQARRDGQRILLQSVAESYYNAQLALYNITIAEANMAFNQQQLDEAEFRYDNGAGSLSNVLNFKVQINRAMTSLLAAKRDYEIGLYSLAVLLGNKDAALPEGITLKKLKMIQEEDFYSLDVGGLITTALKMRPDILQSELTLQRSEAAIGSARAAYYPTVGLKGSVDGSRSDDMSFEGDDFGSTVALSLSYNLYRGGNDEAKLAEAKAAKREANRNLLQQKNGLSGEIRQAYANLKVAQEQLLLQRSTTDLVTQTRDLVKEGYDAGQESLVRLNEAQRDLVETQSNLALSLVGLYRYRYNLKTVTGESLLPYYPQSVSQ